MFLGLRMTEGVSKKIPTPVRNPYGADLWRGAGKIQKYGFSGEKEDFWRFTRKGIHVSNHILADFLQD